MIKYNLTLILAMVLVSVSTAQIIGLTETGDEVLLYKDGTWKYKNAEAAAELEIVTNNTPYVKDENANFLSKSSKVNVGVWIDTKKWSFEKADPNDAAELKFNKKNDDIYGMLITEKMGVPVETLADVAYQNAVEAAPDVEITKKEYRTVNGLKVIMMQMMGTIQEIKFVYFSYYYATDNGAVQMIAYTSQNLFEEYKDEMEKLINGLVELE